MPKMVVSHAVVHVDRWLEGKAERLASMARFGTDVTDHVAADGNNNVAIGFDVQGMAALRAAMASPSPEDAAEDQRHGAVRPVTAYIER